MSATPFPKDLLVAVLTAYVVTDVLISFLSKSRAYSLLEKLYNMMDETNVLMCIALGLLSGVGVYWWLNKNHPDTAIYYQ